MKNVGEINRESAPSADGGWPPGSIGDISIQIGHDGRDLKMAGFGDAEIEEVLHGKRTLENLLEKGPQSRVKKSKHVPDK